MGLEFTQIRIKELVCQTIEEQLKKVEDLIEKIPKNIKVIIMPGNHDPGEGLFLNQQFQKNTILGYGIGKML